jgi:hypothetical protein
VSKTETCWEWHGTRFKDGYGRFYGMGRTGVAHRFAWESEYGPVPEGFLVCHTCDNHACCRNDEDGWYEINGVLRPRHGHLWLGTQAENMADMVAKRRAASGECNGWCRIPDTIVAQIRSDYARGVGGMRMLAATYGVSATQVWNIVTGTQRKGQPA